MSLLIFNFALPTDPLPAPSLPMRTWPRHSVTGVAHMPPKTTSLKRTREANAADPELQDTPSRRTRQEYKAPSGSGGRELPQPSVLEVQEGSSVRRR